MLFSAALKDKKGFQRCFRSGRYCSCSFVTAYYFQNGGAGNRVGISVSKKIGNAVKRNRAKRIIRAAYRLNEDKFPIGCDIVFAARPDINGRKMQDISHFIESRLIKDMNKNLSSQENTRAKKNRFKKINNSKNENN